MPGEEGNVEQFSPAAVGGADCRLSPALSAVGVESSERAQQLIEAEILSAFLYGDDDMTPVTPRSSQNRDTGASTTPSVTPPAAVHGVVPDPQSSENPGVYPKAQVEVPPITPPFSTPANTESPSERVTLSLENGQEVIDAHYKRASKIYQKTRSVMRKSTKRMSVIASRGFQRENPPARVTKPSLHERRHTADVNTVQHWAKRIKQQDDCQDSVTRTSSSQLYEQKLSHETDPVPGSTTITDPIPDAFRYAGFGANYHFRYPESSGAIYLQLGGTTLTTKEFNDIGHTDWDRYELDVWMSDDSLDMAMEVLRRDQDCDAHSIGIANSTMAQICYFANLECSSASEYIGYKVQYEDKRYIFIVINDGIGEFDTNGSTGTHWSFVVLDRNAKAVHYYDSIYAHCGYNDPHFEKGRQVASGMLKILGEDADFWNFIGEWNCPNQNSDNRFGQDGGACGPFVYKMMQVLIRHIITVRKWCPNQPVIFQLDSYFRSWFRDDHFQSQEIRQEIQMRIAHWKAVTEGAAIANLHDQAALGDDMMDLVDTRPMEMFFVPINRPFFEGGHEKSISTSISSDSLSTSTSTRTVVPAPTETMNFDLIPEYSESEDESDGGITIINHDSSDDEENEHLLYATPEFSDNDDDVDEEDDGGLGLSSSPSDT